MAKQSNKWFYPSSKKLYTFVVVLLFLATNLYGRNMSGMLVIDSGEQQQNLPARFRSGVEAKLNISGSEQFSPAQLQAIVQVIDSSPIVIMDLREECHGFINELAISWYAKGNWENLGKPLSEIERLEGEKLLALSQKKNIIANQIIEKHDGIIQKIMEIPLFVRTSYSEKDLCQLMHLQYVRLPISDHRIPSKETVNQFLTHFKQLSNDNFIHFHCRGGKGRTTILFTMYDIAKNAPYLSLESIIERQKKIAGYDFLKELPENHWKHKLRVQRVDFLEKFYIYCKENGPQFESPWPH